MGNIDEILAADDVRARLARNIDATLVDISGSGTLIETSCHVGVGTTGVLHMVVDGAAYADDVRVVRCEAIGATGLRHQVGVEFLWPFRAVARQSLRSIGMRLWRGGDVTGYMEVPHQVAETGAQPESPGCAGPDNSE